MTISKVKKFNLQLFAGVKDREQRIETLTTELRGLIDAKDVDGAKAKREEIRQEKEMLELEKEIESDEKRALEIQSKKKPIEPTKRSGSDKDIEYRAVTKTLLGQELTQEERASVNIGNSGAMLPEGFIKEVLVLREGFPALKPYCHVIPVTTNTGKMPISEGVTNRKLAKLATDTEIVKEMITTKPLEYAVEDYGKIVPVENSVLEDAGVDFYSQVLAPEYAECEVGSENEEILKVITENAVTFPGSDYKAINKCINKVVPLLKKGLVIVTNQTGFDYLDGLEDSTGRPLLKDSLAVEGGSTFKGKEIVVLADEDLAPVTAEKIPFYVVNLRSLVKFFNRKGIEIAKSAEAGFTFNQTFVRMIKRFDVVKCDARACFYLEF